MGDPVPDFTDAHDDADLAWRLCKGLPPQQRACVVLSFREDCSFPTEPVLGPGQGTVRGWLTRKLSTCAKWVAKLLYSAVSPPSPSWVGQGSRNSARAAR